MGNDNGKYDENQWENIHDPRERAQYLKGYMTARRTTIANLKEDNASPEEIQAAEAEMERCKKALHECEQQIARKSDLDD